MSKQPAKIKDHHERFGRDTWMEDNVTSDRDDEQSTSPVVDYFRILSNDLYSCITQYCTRSDLNNLGATNHRIHSIITDPNCVHLPWPTKCPFCTSRSSTPEVGKIRSITQALFTKDGNRVVVAYTTDLPQGTILHMIEVWDRTYGLVLQDSGQGTVRPILSHDDTRILYATQPTMVHVYTLQELVDYRARHSCPYDGNCTEVYLAMKGMLRTTLSFTDFDNDTFLYIENQRRVNMCQLISKKNDGSNSSSSSNSSCNLTKPCRPRYELLKPVTFERSEFAGHLCYGMMRLPSKTHVYLCLSEIPERFLHERRISLNFFNEQGKGMSRTIICSSDILERFATRINSMVITRDGKNLVISHREGLTVFDIGGLDTDEERTTLWGKDIMFLGFGDNNNLTATTDANLSTLPDSVPPSMILAKRHSAGTWLQHLCIVDIETEATFPITDASPPKFNHLWVKALGMKEPQAGRA